MNTLPFSAAVRHRPSSWRRLPLRSGASIVLAIVLWWSLASLSGVSAVTPEDHGPVLPLAEPLVSEFDWPGWQGGTRQGTIATSATLPLQWTLPKSIAAGSADDAISPPCVAGSSIYLIRQARTSRQTWLTCLDRTTGVPRWKTVLNNDSSHEIRTPLPTPAFDGSRVFVTTAHHGELLVTAFNPSGERLWSSAAGPISRAVGPAQSPVLAGSLVTVAIDQKPAPWHWNGAGGFVAGLHRQTGQMVWRTPRTGGDGFATPVVRNIGERRQLVLPGRGSIKSYDAETGQELWTARWSARMVTASVACDDQHVYATSSGPERETLCVRADGTGDVSDTHVLWRTKNAGGSAAPAVIEGSVTIAQEDGAVTALERLSGRVVWQQRLPHRFTTSPLVHGAQLYCFDETGGMTVLDAKQHGQILGQSQTRGPHTVAVACGQFVFASSTGLTLISADGPTQIAHDELPGRARR